MWGKYVLLRLRREKKSKYNGAYKIFLYIYIIICCNVYGAELFIYFCVENVIKMFNIIF